MAETKAADQVRSAEVGIKERLRKLSTSNYVSI